MTRGDEDPSGAVARITAQIRAVAAEADAAPVRSRRLGAAVLLIALLFSLGGIVVAVVVAGRTSGLESADRLSQRAVERLEQNRDALAELNGCLARIGERPVPGPVLDAGEADAWVAARSAALGRLVERGGTCPARGLIAPPAPSRTPSSSSTPRTSSSSSPDDTAPSTSPRTPAGASAPTLIPAPSGAGAGAAPAPAGPVGPAGPAGPAAPAPAEPRVLIPLLPRPLLPPLL